nr:hypothetical protein [Synechococcus sp. PCC 7335]
MCPKAQLAYHQQKWSRHHEPEGIFTIKDGGERVGCYDVEPARFRNYLPLRPIYNQAK